MLDIYLEGSISIIFHDCPFYYLYHSLMNSLSFIAFEQNWTRLKL